MNKLFDQLYFKVFAGCLALEAASLVAFFWPAIALPCLAVMALIALIITAINPRYGAYLIVLELIIGGFGYLLADEIGGFRVSLRLVIFAAALIGWLIYIIRKKDFAWIKQRQFIYFLFLLFFLALGLVLALFVYHRPVGDIFSDINAYLFFGLVGLFLTARIDWQAIIKVFLAATLVTSIKTAVAFYLFVSGWAIVGGDHAYKWIRDTRAGEITQVTDNLHRIFFQSHFYNLLAIIIVAVLLFSGLKLRDRDRNWLWPLLWLNFLAILISQSRSFWLALVICAGLYFIYLIKQKSNFKRVFGYMMIWPLLLVSAHLAVNLMLGTMQINLVFVRATNEQSVGAASSRTAQLSPLWTEIKKSPIWGQGFAKEITYRSSDPRNLTAENPEGWYTTSAFEWGYLDIILKIGFLGLLAYLVFIFGIFKKLFLQLRKEKIYAAFILGAVALLVVNIFTPYLNHPLGIGYLLLMLAI